MKRILILSALFIIGSMESAKAVDNQEYDITNPPPSINLQGGSESVVNWKVINKGKHKVSVFIPESSTAINAIYRIYPKGNKAGDNCENNRAESPCFEVFVNQSENRGKWVDLSYAGVDEWDFSKDGFVLVSAFNSFGDEKLGVGDIRFEKSVIRPRYSKISNKGLVVSDSTPFGNYGWQWACTKDNKTGLTWELKTDLAGPHLRDIEWVYAWGSFTPKLGSGYCTLSTCNTNKYISAINASKLCGSSAWRLPTTTELLTLVNTSYKPTIDPKFFPRTDYYFYWSSVSSSRLSAEAVSYGVVSKMNVDKNAGAAVRLVHN